jgi:Fur family ferric uptake transcriptional regulator
VAVLQHLSTAEVPLSHAEVSEVLVPQGCDKSTLYRCLVEMAERGLLARLDLGDHAWRFELRKNHDEDIGDHPHFMCVDCGKVSCLSDVRILLPKGEQGKIPGTVTEVLLKGHCAECA